MSRARRLFSLITLGALACGLIAALAPPAAADPSVDAGAAFIVASQQADGGFELGGFPGFETPDAVLALAAAGVDVSSITSGGNTPLDVLDDLADGVVAGPLTVGHAAKLVLDALALGLDPAAFDPQGDGATDLVSFVVAAGADPSFGDLNDAAYAVLALVAAGVGVPDGTLAYFDGAQQANGGWAFGGDPNGDVIDPDSTGAVVMALVAGGRSATDPVVAKALAFLATNQGGDGTWADANPNSTALAALAIRATGYDASLPCWRDTAAPDRTGDAYVSPLAALRELQTDDGHFVSPFDEFGVNTFGTSQAVQALSDGDGLLPVTAVAPPCEPNATTAPTTAVTPTTTTGVSVSNVGSVASTGSSTDLPFTGGRTDGLAVVAVALVLGGGVASALARAGRRPVRP